MPVRTFTLFFALLAVLADLFVVVAAVAATTRRGRPLLVRTVGPIALPLAAAVATVATAGSLYLSEVANFVPCRLCWYQRIAMYPIAVVVGVAAFRRDVRAWVYGFSLAVIGLPISIYHVVIEHWPSLETACDVAVPCSLVWVRHFGIVTIPWMAGSGFAAIAALLLVARSYDPQSEEGTS